MCGCLSCTPYRDLACNPGMCPDWEWNQQPFGSQAGIQSTEPHQPEHSLTFNSVFILVFHMHRLGPIIKSNGKLQGLYHKIFQV